MPISSSEIAQLNGSYQAMAMQQYAYAQQMGQGNVYGGGYQGRGGDRAMSGAMNMASSVGAPLAAGAIGLAGLDPMSLGLKAGVGAFAGGMGFGGALAVGGAVALPMMAAGAAVNYVGGQMMQGADQQQYLNAQLRNSFSFRNQYGGQGFQRGDMSSIGSMVREMSNQVGPGGEMASFKELSELSGKMGQMGFAQGVRDVKEFGSRFKDMVKTLKTMATDLGTTLEGAMEFAQAAKGSGVFGMNRIQGFTGAARGASVSGGLAMSEVTGAASIGSQISRSMGGLGRQGAMAGVRTIGQIGTAQQMGILSEEDIYNVTGLTGAEGRQAYAASAMGSSAKFLQSGRGRRMLASIAGKNGTLDESAVNELLQGGMGIGETMKQDQAHLGKVGRANFIRNEGRLRGAAMERLGGFLPGLQMMEWAQSKGVDINDMNDRSMLFAQRQLGMGRDEVDQAIKMAQNMPQIIEQQRRSDEQDKYFKNVQAARKGQGVEGVKQRYEQAKTQLNNQLQKAGQDVFNQGSELVDRFFNKLLGSYVDTYSKDINDSYQAMMGGDRGIAAQEFGIGSRGLREDFKSMGSGMRIGGRPGEDLAASLNRGTQGGLWDSARSGQLGQYLLYGQSGASQLQQKYGINIAGQNSAQIQATIQTARSQQQAAITGMDPNALGAAKGGNFLQQMYAMGGVGGVGPERQQNIENMIALQSQGDPSDPNVIAAKQMRAQLAAAGNNPAKRAALIGAYERAQGVAEGGQLGGQFGDMSGIDAIMAKQRGGGFATTGEANKAFANALGVKGFGDRRDKVGEFFTTYLGARETGVATERENQAGKYIQSKDFRARVSGLFSADKDTATAAREKLQAELSGQVGENAKMSPGELEVNRNLLAGANLNQFVDEFKAKNGREPAIDEINAWMKNNEGTLVPKGATLEGIKQTMAGASAALRKEQMANYAEMKKRAMKAGTSEVAAYAATGIMDAATGELTTASKERLAKLGGGADTLAQNIIYQQQNLASGNIELAQDLGEQNMAAMGGMTVEQKRKLAKELGGGAGAQLEQQATLSERLGKGDMLRQSRAKSMAGILGVTSLSEKDLKGGSDAENAAKILRGMDIDLSTETGKDTLGKLTTALGTKDKNKAGTLMQGVMAQSDVQEATKKKNEAQQEAANPIEAAIKKNTEKTAELLGKLPAALAGSLDGLKVRTSALNAEGK